MIKHIFKLVWNRKKSISLLLIEIFLSFVVAFVAYDMLISGILDFYTPLGFDYHNILEVRISSPEGIPFGKMATEQSAKYRMLYDEIKSLPQVRQASLLLGNIPYGNMRVNTTLESDGKTFFAGINYIGEEYRETMDMSLLDGRWFNDDDLGSLDLPIVIDEELKKTMFGERSAVGEKIQDPTNKKQLQLGTKYNVIGVVRTFRTGGELQKGRGEVFLRQTWGDSSYTPYAAMIKTKEGTNVSFELDLQRRLESLAPDFNFRISPLSEIRENHLRDAAFGVIIPLVVAIFLLLNVMLGLFGIFWQSISRRKGEIGLRRAVGGNSGSIQFQILGESLAIGSLAILAGIPIIVNFAVLGISKPIGSLPFFLAFACAGISIYIILTICAIYPSYRAAHVRPAEALHNE